MAKYGKAAEKRVKSALHREKKGTLKSSSGRRVTSRKQAIAIALSEARRRARRCRPGRAQERKEPLKLSSGNRRASNGNVKDSVSLT
jgi:hypothetical protein